MALFSVGHKRLPCTCPHVYDGLCLIVLHSFCAFWDFRWIQTFFPLHCIQENYPIAAASQMLQPKNLIVFILNTWFVCDQTIFDCYEPKKRNSFGLRAAILRMENQLILGFFGTFFGTSFSSVSNYFFEFTTFWGRKKFHP